jgi:hypothetical protein
MGNGKKTGETGEEGDLFSNSILTGITGLADRTRCQIEWPLRGRLVMTIDRRRFIEVTAAGMVAAVTSWGCAGSPEDVRELAQPALLEMLGAERTREIGTRYRAAVPQESTAAALRTAISSSRRTGFARMLPRSIDAQVHDDFEAGRTVLVSGWVLSQTEARQCALYSLSA